MIALNLDLSEEVLVKFDEYSKELNLTKSKMAENAVVQYLQELEEDRHDLLEAERVSALIASGKMKTHPAEEVYKELGL